jgi:hypothetical protein
LTVALQLCDLVTVIYKSRISVMVNVPNFEVISDIFSIKKICI